MRHLLLAGLLLLSAAAQAQFSVDSSRLLNDIRTLSDDKYEGRRIGSRGSREAQYYLLGRFREIGLQPFNGKYERMFLYNDGGRNVTGTNIYGYIPGESDGVIIITAHYDHVGMHRSSDPAQTDSIFNGADDNASGTSGLLAMAQYYMQHKPRHMMVFAALDGEEEGLQGAKAFFVQPPFPVKQIRLNVNMDMISRNDQQELYASGLYYNPALKPFVDAAAEKSLIHLKTGHDRPDQGHNDWTAQSDQYEFKQRNIPYIYFGVEDHPDYHRASDEFKHIQPSFFFQAVNTVLTFIDAADKGLPIIPKDRRVM
ncbi:peptidase M20 [Chitinophaga parva]|uniref:Peptidase M20 n=1 Tax=Chitinophaga parva TaxID=2169414 RepID=A0A2T7BL47_9BACT|nr:M28 family peptidase [Chitinophaga parva]PUZ28382.1 peptidase M20 [Chitinophaga parva]